MQILRKLGQIASSVLLKFSLFGFATAFALVSVLGTPDNLKQSLEQNGIYDQAVETVINSVQPENADQSIPLDRPEIRAAAQSAFPPQSVQGWAEDFIDGMYGWLEGETDRPEFTIDLSESRQRFIQGIADYAGTRLQSLPACSRQESLALARQGAIDPFSVTCRPPIDIEAEKARLVAEMENREEFLGDTQITADDFPAETFETLDGQSNPTPTYFQWFKRLPVLLAVVSLLAATGVVFLSGDSRRGIKRVGVTLIGTGLFLAIGTLIFTWLFRDANASGGALSKIINSQNGNWQASWIDVINALFKIFNSKLLVVAAIYAVSGSLVLLMLRRQGQHKESNRL